MTDLRLRLQRLGERAAVAPDAFERLERARRRHERNRRITAGAVALLIAVAGSWAVFSAFRTSGGSQPGGAATDDEFFALWPEQTEEGLAGAQEAVDRGDPDLAWRSDPTEVARRFALEKLLWPSVTLEAAVVDGDMIFDLAIPPGSSCNKVVTDAECSTARTTVTMRRLGRQDGLWSITEVQGEDLALPFAAGDVVSGGTWITVPTNAPDGEKVSMGFAFLTGCNQSGIDDNIEARNGALEFYVPAVPDGCTGYIFATEPPTGRGAVAIGSFLFTDATEVPAIGYLVDEIAAVPVLFNSGARTEPSDVAEFICGESGTIAPSSVAVDARADGVHIAVTNTGDAPVSFSVASFEAPRYVLGDDGAEPGERKETVWQLPPGEASVSCGLVSDGGADTSRTADLHVDDPTGSYVPVGMACPRASQSSDHAADPEGIQGGPVEIARQKLSGLEFDDRVEGVGYPESSSPIVRVIRDGNVVALATFTSDGQGSWLIESLDVCVNVPIAWSDKPAGVSGPMGSPSPPNAWDALCSSARADGPDTAHRGADLHVGGRNIEFDTKCLIAPAGEPITIRFSNGDAGIQRNISIYRLTPYLRECLVTGTWPTGKVEHVLFRGEIIAGVDEIVYEVGRMEPGEYYFQDDIHISANGVLVVE
jgi:hypothetical protein